MTGPRILDRRTSAPGSPWRVLRRWIPGATVLLLLVAMLIMAMLPACNRTATSASVNDGFDQFGDRSKSMSAEARVLTRKGEVEYEQAKAQIADGKYRNGIQQLERLIADRTIDPDIREDAMLSVAEAHGSWLNPFRDYDKAVAWCEKLLAEFPDTEKRDYVEEIMARYQSSAAGP